MTVGKISMTCWVIFVVMSVAFLPVGWGILEIHALSLTIRLVLAIVVVLGLWWGPFVYAMYLSLSVVRNGDRRLLRRGIAGTAEVLSAKATNETIQEGEFAWEAPRVYKYRLRVNIPGKAPYETDCRICASGIREGAVVNVAVSPHNHKRVTIDVGQGSNKGAAPAGSAQAAGDFRQPSAAGAYRSAQGAADYRQAQGAGAYRSAQGAGDYRQAQGAADSGPPWGAAYHPMSGSGPAQGFAGFPGGTASGGFGDGGASRPGQPSESERLAMLAQLGQLHSQGVLTDAEFTAQKARILGQ